MSAHIITPCGRTILLDEEDYGQFGHMSWKALRSKQRDDRYYACINRNGKTIYLHRLILAVPKAVLVDHENGDGLDNRRANLRRATRSQNNANSSSRNATGFRGVHMTGGGRYAALISSGPHIPGRGKTQRLGVFDEAEEAARAYDAAAFARFGEFAQLNFPLTRTTA